MIISPSVNNLPVDFLAANFRNESGLLEAKGADVDPTPA